jgi:hypothetical protein
MEGFAIKDDGTLILLVIQIMLGTRLEGNTLGEPYRPTCSR